MNEERNINFKNPEDNQKQFTLDRANCIADFKLHRIKIFFSHKEGEKQTSRHHGGDYQHFCNHGSL